jgi:glycosyltransferase involved in cell wall biosynthesis
MDSVVLFDDIFFGVAQTGIARYWRNLLENLKSSSAYSDSDIEIVILNRSNKLSDLGFREIPFPAYDHWQPASDRLKLTEVCSSLDVSLFVSSYYTFVPGIKNLLPIYDLIPEKMGFARLNRTWLERELAIEFADHFLSISQSTSNDLSRIYGKDPERIYLAKPGVDRNVFNNFEIGVTATFAEKYGLYRYIVFVGNRKDYKNGRLLLELLEKDQQKDLQVVFVGGGPPDHAENRLMRKIPDKLYFLDLNDSEFRECMKSSVCLVYPSEYEGFGLPVLEALSCGTPVIAFDNSSIREAGGDLVVYLSENTTDALSSALERVDENSLRNKVKELGPIHAEQMNWTTTAENFLTAVDKVLESDYQDLNKDSLFIKQTKWSFLTNR